MDKEFFLVRHAESLGNIGLDKGYDPGLSPVGHAQAEQCGELFKRLCGPDAHILSSPFERCIFTAEAIAAAIGAGIHLEPALHELFLPEWFPVRHVRFASLREKSELHNHVYGEYSDERWWPEKNETAGDMAVRAAMLRNRLTGEGISGKQIICVGHWASVSALAQSMVQDIDMSYVPNAGITKIVFRSGAFTAEFVNRLCLQD